MKLSDFDLGENYYTKPPDEKDIIFKPGDIIKLKDHRDAVSLTMESTNLTKDDLFLVVRCFYCVYEARNRIIFRYFRDLTFYNAWGCYHFIKIGENNEPNVP